MPIPSYPEYANPEFISVINKLKVVIEKTKNFNINHLPTDTPEQSISTASFIVPAAEKKPEKVVQVKYTLDWLEIRRKA